MQDVFVDVNKISYLHECLVRYTGRSAYLIVYFCAIIYLILHGSKKEKQIFVPMSVLMIFTVYNPLFPHILSIFADINSEYYRFFWITPVIILVPYVITKLIFRLIDSNFKYRRLFIAAAAVAVLSSSIFIYRDGLVFAENIYKVPDELIKVSELIHADSEDEYPKAFLEFDYNMQMRQYDPKILLTVDRDDYLYAINHEYTQGMIDGTETIYGLEVSPEHRILAALVRYQEVDMNVLLDSFDQTGTEYIVLTKGSTMIEKLKRAGLTEVANTQNHVILKYELKDKVPFELIDYSGVYEEGL